jgi:hypothetical protein
MLSKSTVPGPIVKETSKSTPSTTFHPAHSISRIEGRKKKEHTISTLWLCTNMTETKMIGERIKRGDLIGHDIANSGDVQYLPSPTVKAKE